MSTVNLGRVRGNMWYVGDGIDGISTDDTVFEDSGVTKAYVGDLYLHLESGNTYNGCVYSCTTAGDASTATWVYDGSILGPQPDLYDYLDSTSTTVALTANAGKKLKTLIDEAGIYPFELVFDTSDTGYTMALTIENASTVITLTDADGNTGTYSYTASGTTEDASVSITIGTDIGFAQEGAVIVKVVSSAAAIKQCTITGLSETIVDVTPNLWESIQDLCDEIQKGTSITATSGGTTYTYQTALLYKLISGTLTHVFPVTHAKAVWMEEENGDSVYDEITNLKNNLGLPDEYDETATYEVDEYCMHEDTMYKCTTAWETAGAFDASYWEATDVMGEISQLNSEMLKSTSGTITTVNSYSSGSVAINYYKVGEIVVCNGSYTTGSSVASNINNSLFALPYTAKFAFNFISAVGASTSYISMYANRSNVFTRSALNTDTTYNIAFAYLTDD